MKDVAGDIFIKSRFIPKIFKSIDKASINEEASNYAQWRLDPLEAPYNAKVNTHKWINSILRKLYVRSPKWSLQGTVNMHIKFIIPAKRSKEQEITFARLCVQIAEERYC